jgi:hypothetical protein
LSLQKIATLDFQWNEAGGLREKVQGPDGAAEGENDELKKKQWYIWPGKILTPGQNGVFEAHKAIWPDGNITEQPRDRDLKILAWIKSQSGKFPILRAPTPKSSAEGYVQPTIKAARTKFNFGYPPH